VSIDDRDKEEEDSLAGLWNTHGIYGSIEDRKKEDIIRNIFLEYIMCID